MSFSELVPDDGRRNDVFVRDRMTGTTRAVSGDTAGDPPAISKSGRSVAFASNASLVPGDTDSFPDVFLRHMAR